MATWHKRRSYLFRFSWIFFWKLILISYAQAASEKMHEFMLLSGKNCDFSFSVPSNLWVPDPAAEKYANIPSHQNTPSRRGRASWLLNWPHECH